MAANAASSTIHPCHGSLAIHVSTAGAFSAMNVTGMTAMAQPRTIRRRKRAVPSARARRDETTRPAREGRLFQARLPAWHRGRSYSTLERSSEPLSSARHMRLHSTQRHPRDRRRLGVRAAADETQRDCGPLLDRQGEQRLANRQAVFDWRTRRCRVGYLVVVHGVALAPTRPGALGSLRLTPRNSAQPRWPSPLRIRAVHSLVAAEGAFGCITGETDIP